jgi:hypothetical protein
VIEPEPVPPAPRRSRHRRVVMAGVTVLALVAGGVAVAAGGGRPTPAPLALMAGNGTGTEKAAAPAAATGAAGTASADSRSFAPYANGGWGLTFKVDGTLPSLPDHAPAWNVSAPALDRATVARMAGALGVTATPTPRDGGWFADDGSWTLAAFPGQDMWSISYYRSSPGGPTDGATPGSAPGSASGGSSGSAGPRIVSNGSATSAGSSAPASAVAGSGEGPVGPALSRADAERRVRDLLDRMGAPAASWRIKTNETDIGVGWACAAPAVSSDELTKLEAEKVGPVNQADPGANSASRATPAPDVVQQPTPADKPVATGDVAQCPPPPPPVKGFNVAFFPVLDGHRAEWPVWNLTLRSDGRIENLYGSWVAFGRGGDYKLRGVDAALKELQSPAQLPAVMSGPTTDAGLTGDPAAKGNDGGAVPTPGMATPAIAPVCPPEPMPVPMPAEKATSSSAPICAAPAPQVVTITEVELGLLQAPVFEDGRVRLILVPAYRFLGHFDNGTPWETSVIALHPDAITSPPNIPVADDLRGTGIPAIGKAVPPTPPAPEANIGKPSAK